jgi:hypothetical protein
MAYEDDDEAVVMSPKSAKSKDEKRKLSLLPENFEQGKAKVSREFR